MVLVNAIHLKLPWFDHFQRASTRPDIFTKSDGSTVGAYFMNRKTSLLYTEDDNVQVASLPLAGNAVEFIVFLPKPTLTLAQFEDTLSSSKARGLVAALKDTTVALALPRFAFTTATVSVAQPLITLGMSDAFTPNADFAGITDEKLFIIDVLHKAMIGVDENGVEAAAASAVMMGIGLVLDAKEMTLNRPHRHLAVPGPRHRSLVGNIGWKSTHDFAERKPRTKARLGRVLKFRTELGAARNLGRDERRGRMAVVM